MTAVSSEETVAVRRSWNGADVAQIPAQALWDFHFRNDAGGVCRALPRAFFYAHVWCDELPSGALGHFCREGPPPHDLPICILPNENPAALYERLRAKTQRRIIRPRSRPSSSNASRQKPIYRPSSRWIQYNRP
jgi:hypothetical protein